jgi:hypothetical protein
MIPRIRRLLRLLEIDRAVFYVLLLRGWQFLVGPVTALLIVSYFSPDLQGYYYAFAGLLALQSFLELGFHVVILNAASHEWAKLRIAEDGQIAGDEFAKSRLVSLGRLIAKWYSIVSILFVPFATVAGIVFFRDSPLPTAEWLWPWIVLVVLTSLSLWALPFHALLEGCNQVAEVNRFRLWQALTGNLVVWICIPLGAGLWTCVAISIVKLGWEIALLLGRYGHFFQSFLSPPSGATIPWRTDLWPLQWRLAIQGVFGYFSNWIFTLVMFKYSPAVGGQMGMSWSVLMAIQAASLAWVQTRAPKLGTLVAEDKYGELDTLFRRLTLLSLGFVTAGGASLWGFVYLLHVLQHPLAERLAERVLPLDSLGIFTLAIVLYHVPHCQALYIRAHKREMMLFVGVFSSIAIGTLVWVLGGKFGPIGAAGGYLAVVALFVLPYQTFVWRRCQQERSPADSSAEADAVSNSST